MNSIDWSLFVTGLTIGVIASAVFFAGLGWGMRLALRTARPMAVLLPSAVLRIALLLIVGWWVATLGATAMLGFALGFVVLRTVLVAVLRPSREAS